GSELNIAASPATRTAPSRSAEMVRSAKPGSFGAGADVHLRESRATRANCARGTGPSGPRPGGCASIGGGTETPSRIIRGERETTEGSCQETAVACVFGSGSGGCGGDSSCHLRLHGP